MIQSNNGTLKVEGTNLEIALDFSHILHNLATNNPTLYTGVMKAFINESEQALKKSDRNLVIALSTIIETVIKDYEE